MSKEIKFSEVLKKLEDNRFYHCSEDDDKSIWNRVSFDSRKTIDSPTLLEKVKEEEIDFLINLSLIDKKNLNATIIKGDNYEHNTDLPFIDFSKKWKDNSFDVNTGNLVGFIKQGPYIANISSRFGDEFLMYLIADADGFQEMEDFGSLSKNESELDNQWMLIYLWNIKLRKAYRLGVPKIYQSFKERLAVPRGTLDVIDYAINYKRGK